MDRREFVKNILRFGGAFSLGAMVLPKTVKAQILKPMIDEYCRSYWDIRVKEGIEALRISNPRLLLGDTHVHSLHSDGKYSVLHILSRAYALGLDYVVLTEHITPKRYKVKAPLLSHQSQEESLKVLQDMGIKPPEIYPAAEISAEEGHLIALFPKSYFGARDFSREFHSAFSICGERFVDAVEIIGKVKALGGKIIVPHPGETRWRRSFGVPWEILEGPLQGLVDGIEDMNTGNGCFGSFAAGLGLSSLGASDDHFKALLGTSVTAYDGLSYSDLTDALAEKATQGFQTARVNPTLLHASLFFYAWQV